MSLTEPDGATQPAAHSQTNKAVAEAADDLENTRPRAGSTHTSGTAGALDHEELKLQVEDPPQDRKHPVAAHVRVTPVTLVFDQVSVDVEVSKKAQANAKTNVPTTTKRILSAVSGAFHPGELTAVMGPSGSGKTTMLSVLSGVIEPSAGRVLATVGVGSGSQFGPPQPKAYRRATMKHLTALVPQDDLLTPQLTVEEALHFAAKLKLGASKGPAAVAARRAAVDDLISDFGLEECRSVLIGHAEGRKGISGGQKKRLSVALELLAAEEASGLRGKKAPSLLFLDEPTSGLDAVSAVSLVRLLKRLAKQRHMNIICTIHQPSASIFFTFDKCMLLVGGEVCYFGGVGGSGGSGVGVVSSFAEAGFTCPQFENPADFLMETVMGDGSEARCAALKKGMAELAKAQAADPMMQTQTQSSTDKKNDSTTSPGSTSASSPPTSEQFRVLLHRAALVLLREPLLAKARIGSHIMVGVVTGVLYWQLNTGSLAGINDRIALLLFSMIFLMLSNVLPTILAVLPELAVTVKEHRNSWYEIKPYYMSKVVVDLPLILLPVLLFALINGSMSHLLMDSEDEFVAERFGRLVFAFMLHAVCSQSWGMFLSCLAPDLGVAIFMAPISLLPQILFAGFFKNVQDISWVFRWFSYVDFICKSG